jgi:hypothetical protein
MGSGEDVSLALERARKAFEKGDFARARRLLEPLCDEEGEIGSEARNLLSQALPDRRVLWVGLVCVLAFSVLFGYYVVAR